MRRSPRTQLVSTFEILARLPRTFVDDADDGSAATSQRFYPCRGSSFALVYNAAVIGSLLVRLSEHKQRGSVPCPFYGYTASQRRSHRFKRASGPIGRWIVDRWADHPDSSAAHRNALASADQCLSSRIVRHPFSTPANEARGAVTGIGPIISLSRCHHRIIAKRSKVSRHGNSLN
jgi:hypothetical protein